MSPTASANADDVAKDNPNELKSLGDREFLQASDGQKVELMAGRLQMAKGTSGQTSDYMSDGRSIDRDSD